MNMTLIETIELTSSASSIAFSSIPLDYDDLLVKISARGDRNNPSEAVTVLLNSDTNNMFAIFLAGYNGGPGSFSVTNNLVNINIPGSTAAANTFSNASIYISNYKLSQPKTLSSESVYSNNSTLDWQVDLTAGFWNNTAIVNSITATTNSGNFVSGSVVSLYGISNIVS